MKLPLLVSVPHAGESVPPEARPYCRLSHADIVADGDEGAGPIYDLGAEVDAFVTTDVARAIVDVNRAADDFSLDGVIKTHTCWHVPVYEPFPPPDVVQELLNGYYAPYHQALATGGPDVRLCVDCHTMAAAGPPVGPDPDSPRPDVCLSDVDGTTLPPGWMEGLAGCFAETFGESVTINHPFHGGYITRHHGRRRPWVQIELSRAPFLPDAEKRACVLAALRDFCRRQGWL